MMGKEEGDRAEAQRRKARRLEPVPSYAALPCACLSAAARHLSLSLVDALAEMWGVRALVAPGAGLDAHAIKYGTKRGRLLAMVEATLVKRLRPEQLGVPVPELAEELGWDTWLRGTYGALPRVLSRCPASFLVDRGADGVPRVSAAAEADKAIVETPLPSGSEGRDRNNALIRSAIDDVLNVLPRGRGRTMLSAVGVRLNGWLRFNQRFQGVLGENLTAFLLRHPESFCVEGRIVWRTDPNRAPDIVVEKPKWGGRNEDGDADSDAEWAGVQRKPKRKSRRGRLHDTIAEKWERRKTRANKLRSLKMQKIPGFGQKKRRHSGKGTKPHWMKGPRRSKKGRGGKK